MSIKNNITERFLRFLNTPAGGKWVPYAYGNRKLYNFCQTPYAHQNHFKRKGRLFNTFLQELDIKGDYEKLTREKFFVGFQKNWRTMAVSYLKPDKVDKYFEFVGLENFQKYYDEKKGIVLVNSHFGLAESALALFPMIGFNEFYTIVADGGAESIKFQGLNKKLGSKQLIFSNQSGSSLLKTMFKAKQVLNDGGITHVLGDGNQGNSNLTLPFLKKIRGYRASFAELGLSTDARIIPILISLNQSGKFKVHFHEPLDKGDESLAREERIRIIVSQYARILEKSWLQEPQQINWGHVKTYLQYVSAE